MSLITAAQETELEHAIRSAGSCLLEHWPGRLRQSSSDSDLEIETKSDGSVVTQADFRSNEIIVQALQTLFPDDAILSEELPAPENLQERERLWIIDPLDGTQTFIDGNDDFSILVALCIGSTPRFGFMHFPAREQFAVGKHGVGAFINGERLRVSDSLSPGNERVYLRNIQTTNIPMAYPRWMDSGCALMGLGRGELDGIIIRLLSHREWDLAAPAVMIEEAGGTVTDEFGNSIAFNKGGMPCRYVVASNGKIHDSLLRFLEEHEGV